MSRQRPPKQPSDPLAYFGEIARAQVVAEPVTGTDSLDGALRLKVEPQRSRDFHWHKPETHVPELQWSPSMGITRYEFARRTTPADQLDFFLSLQQRCQVAGIRMAPDELWAYVQEKRDDAARLHNGLPGDDFGPEFYREIGRYVTKEVSPDGQWQVLVQAVRFGKGIADRIDVRHRDYRTIADWELLVRIRSWVLPDDRLAFMLMPGTDIHAQGWEQVYENATPNNLQLISPRHEAES